MDFISTQSIDENVPKNFPSDEPSILTETGRRNLKKKPEDMLKERPKSKLSQKPENPENAIRITIPPPLIFMSPFNSQNLQR